MDLSKKVFGANVDEEIRNYFKYLEDGNFTLEPGQPVGLDIKRTGLGRATVGESYLGDRTPYARMWTAVNVKEETDKKPVNETYVYSINENREDSYNPNVTSELDSLVNKSTNSPLGSSVNYKNQLENNPYLKPSAGITSINSKSEGAVGALRRTSVSFMVHNKDDFEKIFLPFFLKPGSSIFVDFGWSDKSLSLYNPESLINVNNVTMNDFYKKLYDDVSGIKKGFQTTLSGQVTKYDVNVDEKGSFVCNLEFVSSNYALLDKTVSDDNDLKFIFENAIEEILMNYYTKVTGIKVDTSQEEEDIQKIPVSERKKLVQDFFDAEVTPSIVGKIDQLSLKSGVFYQNLTSGENDEDKIDEKESLYISYGLFEDLFLNNFISFWEITNDSGEVIEELNSNQPFSNSFSSQNSYVRYDKNLFDLQSLKMRSSDERMSFLYPSDWTTTYNKLKPNGWENAGGVQNDTNKRRIPLRELFISVPTISEAFRKSQNVNDALEFIFDEIYNDSGNIINIKMISNNDAQTSITFQDVNVEADKFRTDNEEILTFDITSGNSVVLNSDLKFETPKAGLSSMIAIGNIDAANVFDELELMKFNFLNAITTENRKFKVQHLPIYGKQPSKRKALDINMNQFLKDSDVKLNIAKDYEGGFTEDDFPIRLDQERYNNFIEERKKAIEREKTKKSSNENNKTNKVEAKERPSETSDGRQIFYVKSERDRKLTDAKINSFIKSDENSISPVMPITLSLKIYGNNFLGIGDFFTVNFLPKHYQDRVYFQIVGINHNVGTSMWDTTYETVMRLKSNNKYFTGVNSKSEELRAVTKYDDEVINKKTKEMDKNKPKEINNKAFSIFTKDIQDLGSHTTHTANRTIGQITYTTEQFPDLQVFFERVIINPNHNKEQYEKASETRTSFGTPLVSKTKQATCVSIPEAYDNGSLAYHIAISNLFLGDELIDWDLVSKSGKIPKFDFKNINNTIQHDSHYINRVSVISRNVNGKLNARYGYKKDILSAWDNMEKSIFSADLLESNLDENEKPVDDKIKNIKQNLSKNIIPNPSLTGFYFIYSMIWELEDDDNNFVNIQIQGHKDVNVFNNILIPEKYLKIKSPKLFIERLRRDYLAQKIVGANLDEYFDREEKENPGFPFSDPFYSQEPFGSYENKDAARSALATAYGFNGSYIAYKNARDDQHGDRSSEVRKQDWLNRPDIW